jgi:tetratricopeptide (TPR) repeat protein
MNKIYFLLFLFITHLSCKTPGKAYEKGNYTEAIDLAIKKLQKNPNDGEAKSILQNAYKFAVNRHEEQIRILSNSNSEKRFEQIYQQYRSLQNLSENIRRYPTAAQLVNTVDYSDYLTTYKDKAADLHYESGVKLMQENTKPAFREAYHAFKRALRLKPNDIELRKRADEAYRLAVVNVVVIPIDNHGGYMYSNSYQVRNFQEDLVRNLGYNVRNEFIKFHSEWNARSMNIEPDEIIEMRFGNLVIGQPYDQRQTRQVSKEVVLKEIVYKPDSVVKQTGKVYARVTTTRRTLVSSGDLFINIRDAKGRFLWSDNFRGEHRWQTEFATFTGDERALSDHDRSLLNRRDYAPQQDEIISELLRQIDNELAYRLRNYYSRY